MRYLFLLLLFVSMPLSAAEKQPLVSPSINKSTYDKQIDALINKALGIEFRRTTIYDKYPLTLPPKQMKSINEKELKALVDYYDYARKDLRKANMGELSRVLKVNFDGDKVVDYATVVTNTKEGKNFLAIFNEAKILLLEEWDGDYLEPVNRGSFPVTIPSLGKPLRINAPAIRLFNFDDNKTMVLFWDKLSQAWSRVPVDI